MSDDLLLPEGSPLLHVGPQKTGTTSIQVALAAARDALPALGAYYPAGDHRRRRAGWALGLPGGPRDTPIRYWEDLVTEVRAVGDLRACISDENFARAEPDVARRIVEDLGGDRVHVVAVARRLDLYLPSQWQERVKAGIHAPFEGWLHEILGDQPERSWERWNVWMGHDTEALVRRWVEVVGPDRFTLVVADETDRTQLIGVFQAMLGLPEGTLRLHPDRSNRGFGLAEVELVRRLRVRLAERQWSRDDFRAVMRRGVRATIAARPDRAPGPRHAPLPGWAFEQIQELSDRRAAALPGLGVRVIGDPEWLRVPDAARPGPVDLDALSLPVDLVVDVIDALVGEQRPTADRAVPATGADLGGRELARLLGSRIARRVGIGRT